MKDRKRISLWPVRKRSALFLGALFFILAFVACTQGEVKMPEGFSEPQSTTEFPRPAQGYAASAENSPPLGLPENAGLGGQPEVLSPPRAYLPQDYFPQVEPAQPTPQAAAGSSGSVQTFADGRFYGIKFAPGEKEITMRILPDKKFNGGREITLTFLPGKKCEFGDKQACVYSYLAAGQTPVIFLSLHSGLGGEAEEFRHAVEGSGINRAWFPPEEIKANLNGLRGARVLLEQSGKRKKSFQIAELARVPSEGVQEYFASPIEKALEFALEYEPRLADYTHPPQPILVFETCGWKAQGEPWADGVTATTGSVYVVVIESK